MAPARLNPCERTSGKTSTFSPSWPDDSQFRLTESRKLRPAQAGGTVEEQVANRASPIAGHRDAHLARRFAADDHHGFAVLVLDGTNMRGVHQPSAMDPQELAAERRFDGRQRQVDVKAPACGVNKHEAFGCF